MNQQQNQKQQIQTQFNKRGPVNFQTKQFYNYSNINQKQNQSEQQNFWDIERSEAFKKWQEQIQLILKEMGENMDSNNQIKDLGKSLQQEQKILLATLPLMEEKEVSKFQEQEIQLLKITAADSFFNSGLILGITLQSNIREAVQLLQEALKLKTELHGEDSLQAATVMINLGRIFNTYKMNLDKSYEYHKKVLSIYEQNKIESRQLVRVVNGYCYVLYQLGKINEAKEMHQNSLRIVEIEFPNENYLQIDHYNGLGLIYRDEQQFEKSLEQFNKALELQQGITEEQQNEIKQNGTEFYYPQYETLVNISSVYKEQENFELELEYLNRAVIVQRQMVPETHLSLFDTYMKLGMVEFKQKQYNLALNHYQKGAIWIQQRYITNQKLEKNQINQVTAIKANYSLPYQSIQFYQNVGELDYAQNQIENGEKSFKAATQIAKNIFGEKSQQYQQIQINWQTIKQKYQQ